MARRQDHGSDFPSGIGAPARRALAKAGYSSLAQLARVRESELLRLHGVGPKAVGELRAALRARGRAFAPERETRPAGSTE